MAKKLFFHRRHKLPPWAQIYSVWGVVAVAIFTILFFTSVETVSTTAPHVKSASRNFAEGLYYDLRESGAGERFDVLYGYAKRLTNRAGFRLVQEKKADCAALRLTRGSEDVYSLAATVSGNKTQAAFHLLAFLEYASANHAQAAFDAYLVFAEKKCDAEEAVRQFKADGKGVLVELTASDGTVPYNAIGALKNLQMRPFFESAFLSPERTTWTNVMATVSSETNDTLTLPVKAAWAKTPEAQAGDNPLWRHPALAKEKQAFSTQPVAAYLGGNTQLYNGGFTVFLILFWLLALLPFVNATGTYKERLDIAAALTSTVLYALAFFVYLLVAKMFVAWLKSDVALITLLAVLLPTIFVPLRLLQKSTFRDELNRAGIHLWVLFFLTVALFINPLVAVFGLCCLMLLSAFARAGVQAKLVRAALLLLLFYFTIAATSHPLGSFTNYMGALLPDFSAAGVLKLLLTAFIGGGLVSFLFVPRERN